MWFQKLCWLKVVRVGILDLFLILEEMLSAFHHGEWCLLWVCHIWSLLCWGRSPLSPHSGEVFFLIINQCCILSKVLSASIEMIIWFLFFNLLMGCITLIDLQILKNPFIPRVNSTWSWCMILLMWCWILFASILSRVCVCFHVPACVLGLLPLVLMRVWTFIWGSQETMQGHQG